VIRIRFLIRAFGIVVALNATFLAFALVAARFPPPDIQSRVQKYFLNGDLTIVDWPGLDRHLGATQYNDCIVLQMVTNDASSVLDKAISPDVYVQDSKYHDLCATYRKIIFGTVTTSSFYQDKYSRYWHGYVPSISALLWIFDLEPIRRLLTFSLFVAIAAFGLAAWSAQGLLRRSLVPVAMCAAAFWSVPFFGPCLSFAPADIALFVGLTALVLFRSTLRYSDAMIAACGAFGALVTYFDFLTGALPTAASLLVPIAYLIGRDQPITNTGCKPAVLAAFALGAFVCGAAMTVAIKQAIVFGVSGGEALHGFFVRLALYTGHAGGVEQTGVLQAVKSLLLKTSMLTYGSRVGAALLLITAVACWIGAAFLAFQNSRSARESLMVQVAGAAVVPAWVALMPTHTDIHAYFMVRMLIAPIALGFGALVLQLGERTAKQPPKPA
jgi:hypothetical protein